MFLAASCGTSAWVWHGRNEAWWRLWLLPAGLCLVIPTMVLLRRRHWAPGRRSPPSRALRFAIAGGVLLFAAGVMRGRDPSEDDGLATADVLYIATVGASTLLLVTAGVQAFRESMARAETESR